VQAEQVYGRECEEYNTRKGNNSAVLLRCLAPGHPQGATTRLNIVKQESIMSSLKIVETKNIPGAWYELSGRISAARAVIDCALESLPVGLQGMQYGRINNTGHLIAAVQYLLDLMDQDSSRLEQQLKA